MYLIYIMCVSEQLSMCKHDHRVHTKVGTKKKVIEKRSTLKGKRSFFFRIVLFLHVIFVLLIVFLLYSFLLFIRVLSTGCIVHTQCEQYRLNEPPSWVVETLKQFTIIFYLRFFIRCVEQFLVAPKHRRNIQFSGIFL